MTTTSSPLDGRAAFGAVVSPSPMLVTALRADALASGGLALLQLALPDLLAAQARLPASLLVGSGLFLVGYVVLLLVLAAARRVWRPLIAAVVAGNVGWTLACIALAFVLAPAGLGIAYLVAQAACTLALAAWQGAGLRRSDIVPE